LEKVLGLVEGNAFPAFRLRVAADEAELLRAYREQGLPVTIVRPSYTYGPSWIPSRSTHEVSE
jgi:nucleoside-diphosphate-sugar epimerase